MKRSSSAFSFPKAMRKEPPKTSQLSPAPTEYFMIKPN